MKDKQQEKNKECLFATDLRPSRGVYSAAALLRGDSVRTRPKDGGALRHPLGTTASILKPAQPALDADYPLFALPGESFEHFTERALSHLESKECGSALPRPKKGDNRGEHPVSHSNPFTVLEGVNMDGCTRSPSLRKKAMTLVKWYRRLGLPFERDLPADIRCGDLRVAVRQCFSQVSDIWELSFKTIQKIEQNCCDDCLPRFSQRLNQWKSARSQPVSVDTGHLERFKRAFGANVDKGWDDFRSPFIPNGNATKSFKRRQGGNWNVEPIDDGCRVELVFSSGKPRVVTMYSSGNTEVLAPLHYSLHSSLKRKGWLLVGDPRTEHISKLTGTKFLSFDYSSATDMIKTAYVQAAVEVLISKATHLSDDEIRALRVLSTLTFAGGDGETTRGQPMGSIMSFPLLCLMNKTVVDLALTELLIGKKISFREWSGHPCLINGDDLLLKEVRRDTNLREQIIKEGSEVGFVVNEEKTLVSEQKAEINSTLFDGGVPLKKLNVSALWMKPDVEDVLGFAQESSVDAASFRRLVRANCHILAKQQDKRVWAMSSGIQALCRKDKKIRRALRCSPVLQRPVQEGVMRMAEKPEGYWLSREEEYRTVREEVERVREMGILRATTHRIKFRTSFVPNSRSFNSLRKVPLHSDKELILKCLVDRYDLKIKEDLVLEELADFELFGDPPFDGSRIDHMVDIIRAGRSTPLPRECSALHDFVCV